MTTTKREKAAILRELADQLEHQGKAEEYRAAVAAGEPLHGGHLDTCDGLFGGDCTCGKEEARM